MGYLHAVGIALVCQFADAVAPPTGVKHEVLDKVAAVVNDRPIFLSEVRQRARPHFVRVDQQTSDTEQRAAGRAALYPEMLNKIIDERLQQEEADRGRITVEPSQVEGAIAQIAKQSNVTPAELFVEAKRLGLSEQEYREDVRRQVLEGKLILLRVRARVHVKEADARALYDAWVKEQTGPGAPVDLRILALSVAADASDASKNASEALAKQLSQRAKAGADFCALVKQYGSDPSTSTTCGSRGPLRRSQLFAELAKAAGALRPGETTAPILVKDPSGGRGFLVVQRAPATPIPTYAAARQQWMDRATTEEAARQHKQWLVELRNAALVDVRM